ncbi:MAG: hypothetical protein ACO36E_03410 [Synechocystis sp.]
MKSPTDLLLSAATLPMLSALALLHCLNRHSTEWGQLSEEVFRGDRLPILPFPDDAAPPAATEAATR